MMSWLKIKLEVQKKGNKIDFHVHFFNTSEEIQYFAYSNVSRKAEFISLKIWDENQIWIKGRRLFIFSRYGLPPAEKHEIAPGTYWEYILEGEYLEGRLVFEAADYELKAGQKYFAHFEYGNVVSEQVPFSVG